MHICIHDFAGHPFTIELARALAQRGHQITYAWFAKDTGPKGQMTKLPEDPTSLKIVAVGMDIDYSKTNFMKRRAGDILYGRELGDLIQDWAPDVLISGNTPTEAQEKIVAACNQIGVPFIYWCQDFYSIAATQILRKRVPIVGSFIGFYYRWLERRQMQRSTRVVLITEAFRSQTNQWEISEKKVDVIENWGPLKDIPIIKRNNEWAEQNTLLSGVRFLYSGTLALKHNPEFLKNLSLSVKDNDQVIIVSAGVGYEQLLLETEKTSNKRLFCFGLQPFELLPEVLGSADVLLAVIENDAGKFSVPSKVLSYLCAGKPIVLAAPSDNLASQIVVASQAGKVVQPDDIEGFIRESLFYRDNPNERLNDGERGRKYAEDHFDIEKICDRFELLFSKSRQFTPTDQKY